MFPQTKVELLFSYDLLALTAEIETSKSLIPYMKSVVHLRCHHLLPTQHLKQKRNGLGKAQHPTPCSAFWKAWLYLELSPLSFPALGLYPGYKLFRTENLSDILKVYCHFCPILQPKNATRSREVPCISGSTPKLHGKDLDTRGWGR